MREEQSGNRSTYFGTALAHRFVFNSTVFVGVVVRVYSEFVLLPNTSKKLAHSQIVFFEMQMELECLSTVPVALMGQSVESIECAQKTKREG